MTKNPPTEQIIQQIARDKIEPDPDQPRKYFDEQKLAELAETIKVHGIIVPLTLRPHANAKKREAGHFIIDTGERRWRAAEIAGLAELPSIVLADGEQLDVGHVLERQLIENTQRADLSPLEEGETYRRLKEGFSVPIEDLMSRTGKSRSQIYARIALTKLPASVKKAIGEGKLTSAIAELAATIGDPKLQEQFAKECLGEDSDALDEHGILPEAIPEGVNGHGNSLQPLSYRAAKELLRRKYSTRLSLAKFDTTDETLTKAGACGPCPYRSGAQLELGVKGAGVATDDVCVKPSCFEEKTSAAWKKVADAAKLAGTEVVSDKAAKDMFAGAELRDSAPYIDLAGEVPYDMLATPGKPPTWGKLLGKKAGEVPRVLAKDGTGAPRELLDKAEAVKILREAGKLEKPGKAKAAKSTSISNAGEAKKEERAKKLRHETLMRVLDAIGAKVSVEPDAKRELAWMRWIGRALVRALDLSGGDAISSYFEHLGCETFDAFIERIDTAKTAREVRAMIVLALAAEHSSGRLFGWVGEQHNDVFNDAMKLFGVTWDKHEELAQLAAEHEEASLAASQEAAKVNAPATKPAKKKGGAK